MPEYRLSIEHPEKQPAWIDNWLTRDEVLSIFNKPAIKTLGFNAINHAACRVLNWGDNYLQAELAPQVATWRYRDGKWSPQCTCGIPGSVCPHAFAAVWLFGELCRQMGWQSGAARQTATPQSAGPAPGRPVQSTRQDGNFFFQSPAADVVRPAQQPSRPRETGDLFFQNEAQQPVRPVQVLSSKNGFFSTSQPVYRQTPTGRTLDSFNASRPRPQQIEMFQDNLPNQKREMSLIAEVDYKHDAERVGLRFYSVEKGEKNWLSLLSMINFAQEIRSYGERSIRHWNEDDRKFLLWVSAFIRRVSRQSWNMKMLTVSQEDFLEWRVAWKDSLGRFIERISQKPLPPPGQILPVAQFAELRDEGDMIVVAVGFRYPDNSRKYIHEIFQQLAEDPNAPFTRRQLMSYEPPVPWSILNQYFARKSPRMPRKMVPTHLDQLLNGRCDIIEEGPCVVKHTRTPHSVIVNCSEEYGHFCITCQLDGRIARLDTPLIATAKTIIREQNGKFHVDLMTGGEAIPALQKQLIKFAEESGAIEGNELKVLATPSMAMKLRDLWMQFPDGVEHHCAKSLKGLLGDDLQELHAAVNAREDWGMVALTYNWQIDGQTVQDSELRAVLRGTCPALRLSNGSWFALDAHQAQAVMKEYASADIKFDVAQRMMKREAQENLQSVLEDKRFVIAPANRQFCEALITTPPEMLPLPPSELSGVLRDYQRVGYDFLNERIECGLGAILADDMGLGKTLQLLSVLRYWQMKACLEHKSFRALVVCPATVIGTWISQGARFVPELKMAAMIGTPKQRERILASPDIEVLVTHYGLLRSDYQALAEMAFDFAILDEAQNIKNPEAAVTVAAKGIKAEHRIALTGTPLENRPLDLWSIMDFLNPGYLGNMENFNYSYEIHSDYGRLHGKLRPLMLRRTKTEVAKELPPRTVEVLYTPMEEGQRSLYDQCLKESREQLATGDTAGLLGALTRLREICCDPQLLLKEPHDLGSSKLAILTEKLAELLEGGHSVLVFSSFATMLEIIRQRLAEMNLPVRMITGQTSLPERDRLVREFSESSEPEVFLLSLKAAGTGLTLTKADYVFNYDPWWNPAAENQAIDRTHRIGQTKPVTAYKMIAKDTIEERVLELMETKRAIFEAVVGSSDESAVPSRLTREDLINLLK